MTPIELIHAAANAAHGRLLVHAVEIVKAIDGLPDGRGRDRLRTILGGTVSASVILGVLAGLTRPEPARPRADGDTIEIKIGKDKEAI